MHESTWWILGPWSNFYVVIGSSAAALTGLMFVVLTLVAGVRSATTHTGLAAFTTPNVVHFCAALFLSALLVMPWRSLAPVAVLAGITSVYGIVYVGRVILLTWRIESYDPDTEDWCWYAILPMLAYLAVGAAAIFLTVIPRTALFVLAGATLLLIFIGIRNAWDVVTWITVRGSRNAETPSSSAASDESAASDRSRPNPEQN
jgi:hypothetical protein